MDGSFWRAALEGMADPAVIALVLALTTLLVEDLAIAAGAALAARGDLSWELAFAAVAGGIALGDVGLYALGAAARRSQRLQRRLVGPRSAALRARLVQRLGAAMLLARVVPGLRLATYTACGFLRIAFVPFGAWVLAATAAWTFGLFTLGSAAGERLAASLGWPRPLAVAVPIVAVALLIVLLPRLAARLADRRASAHTPCRSTAAARATAAAKGNTR